MLYVTHAADEVTRLADQLVLIEAGKVIACGPLAQITTRSDLPFGERDDAGAALSARVVEHIPARALTCLKAAGATLLVPLMDAAIGAACRARIPAREVILAVKPPDAISVQNILPGNVVRITDETARHSVLVEIALPGGALLSRVTPDAVNRLSLTKGSAILALIKSTSIEVLGP